METFEDDVRDGAGEAGYYAFEIAEPAGRSDIHTTGRYVRVMAGKKREAVSAVVFGLYPHRPGYSDPAALFPAGRRPSTAFM